jgi:predicted NBD/HSP70 family sugar kinase
MTEDFTAFCEQLDRGEPVALKTISEWASMLSLGIVSIIDLLNPSHIILGGPLARFFPSVQRPLSLLLQSDLFPGAKAVQLTQSRFKEDACAMGAAALVYESLFRVVQDRDVRSGRYWIAEPLHPQSHP